MTKLLLSFSFAIGLSAIASNACAAPVDYVKVCGSQGTGFRFIPGTAACINDATGEVRVASDFGVWKTIYPYREGEWVITPSQACGGRLVKLGDFKTSDFTLNGFGRKQTLPLSLSMGTGEFISKVMMKGGFTHPLFPGARSGINVNDGLCLRSIDPSVFEAQSTPPPPLNPPFGVGGLPIACISNTRIRNMPAAYSIPATAAYPNIDVYFLNLVQTMVAGPYVYGKQVVVTTDGIRPDLATFGYCPDPNACTLPVYDPVTKTWTPAVGFIPYTGTLTVWACVEGGKSGNGNAQ